MKVVPASAKSEKLRREDTCSLPESRRYTVADLQSLGFGLPTSLMNPPRSLFSAARFSSIRPEAVGTMASMISKGPGGVDGAGPGLDTGGGGATEGEGNSGVVSIGGGKVGYRVGCGTMDVIVVTTPPGNGYGSSGVSRGAK